MEDLARHDALLRATRAACESHPEVGRFVRFPDNVASQPVEFLSAPACELLRQEQGFPQGPFPELQKAIHQVLDQVHWRQHYRDSHLGQAFNDRFGCFGIIGEEGPCASEALRAWVVYMPPNLYYPWHEHVAEELYLVIAGSAIFRKEGSKDVVLRAGDTVFHAANQPHATETGEEPVLCLVLWRDDFEHGPVLTDPARVAAMAAQ